MSLHIVVNGMTSGQRMRKQKKEQEMEFDELHSAKPKWLNETSMNNLSDVYQVKRNDWKKRWIGVICSFGIGEDDSTRRRALALWPAIHQIVKAQFLVCCWRSHGKYSHRRWMDFSGAPIH